MAQSITDRRDQDFVLHEVLEVSNLSKYKKFADFNRKTMDMVVREARNLAVKEILPTQKDGDNIGCSLENGKVKVPPSYHKIFGLICEGEWLAMCEDPEYGGQGMPEVIAMAVAELFIGANCSFMLYPAMNHGAGKLVEEFGTKNILKIFTRGNGPEPCVSQNRKPDPM